ncbi:MAG: alpha-E domain-containing protein [Candidatus Dactylopiibacterium sp.]|nr:alpha-E domain-containing protein [Candidatus Dactylopiibacterium sp.]
MLSRTADHLYWMARYIERAENLARMLDVNNRMLLLPQSEHEITRLWRETLDSIGLLETYTATHADISPSSVVHFMALDRTNPGSIYSCLRAARENAHAVRGTLTAELWETINATWLDLRGYDIKKMGADELDGFFEWVKLRSHQSRGVTFATMTRDESNSFLRLGTFIERADNTARILDVKYNFISEAPRREASGEYYQWSALLHSVSAFETYRRTYRDQITPARVAELLILRMDMPRSLAYCTSEMERFLSQVCNSRSAETQRRAGELASSLRYGRLEDILDTCVHAYLTRFIIRVNDIGNRLAADFMLPATV